VGLTSAQDAFSVSAHIAPTRTEKATFGLQEFSTNNGSLFDCQNLSFNEKARRAVFS
jgi:hypothetical protein